MSRLNACPNPALGTDATGWSGTGTPVRATGLTGMQRATGARTTTSGYVYAPAAPAGPGETWTLSFDIKNNGADFVFGKDLYFVSDRSAGGQDFQQLADTPALAVGEDGRGSITATTPALTTGISLLLDGLPVGMEITAVLYEEASSAAAYFDGDSDGAVWNGTEQLSSSTLLDEDPPEPTTGLQLAAFLDELWAVLDTVARLNVPGDGPGDHASPPAPYVELPTITYGQYGAGLHAVTMPLWVQFGQPNNSEVFRQALLFASDSGIYSIPAALLNHTWTTVHTVRVARAEPVLDTVQGHPSLAYEFTLEISGAAA